MLVKVPSVIFHENSLNDLPSCCMLTDGQKDMAKHLLTKASAAEKEFKFFITSRRKFFNLTLIKEELIHDTYISYIILYYYITYISKKDVERHTDTQL